MRIIAGSAKGKRIDAPEGMDTRPTLDRVKEALFGAFQFDIPGSAVLDLFSGSGNLGIEAASRGASRVVCNDHSGQCVRLIRQNAQRAGLSQRITVLQLDYRAAIERLKQMGESFDFAFLDAPYRDGIAGDAASLLFQNGLMKPGGRILLEHLPGLPPQAAPGVMEIAWTRKYGHCAITMLKEEGQA